VDSSSCPSSMAHTNGHTSIQNKMGGSEAFVLGFNRDSWLNVDCFCIFYLDNQLVSWIIRPPFTLMVMNLIFMVIIVIVIVAGIMIYRRYKEPSTATPSTK